MGDMAAPSTNLVVNEILLAGHFERVNFFCRGILPKINF